MAAILRSKTVRFEGICVLAQLKFESQYWWRMQLKEGVWFAIGSNPMYSELDPTGTELPVFESTHLSSLVETLRQRSRMYPEPTRALGLARRRAEGGALKKSLEGIVALGVAQAYNSPWWWAARYVARYVGTRPGIWYVLDYISLANGTKREAQTEAESIGFRTNTPYLKDLTEERAISVDDKIVLLSPLELLATSQEVSDEK
jgi:hypothetical protein